ncbi:putative copper chaperone COX17-1 [Cardiosporidium cionae]|uniref:Copper chaperone COX17-1 n=1 Tax=Cardiosporidium cionae TaxID=476202 RepID=A0ABQ7J7T7_9APIC|nr:putative copper chaperone COX17-1 [Cardiosporidium cionae]|eukprot:KAF8820059.1 putative copper chaperone COX17-1 [Cardiosporidium cionae]
MGASPESISSSSSGPSCPPFSSSFAAAQSGPKKRICCVCKETKSVRDECIVLNGEEKCAAFIEAHNQCLRREGFDVK